MPAEAAFATEELPVIADLRAARYGVNDAESFRRIRTEDNFMDVPVFDAFDAVAFVPETNSTEYVTAQPSASPDQMASSPQQAPKAEAAPAGPRPS